jgi:hypothetical protein
MDGRSEGIANPTNRGIRGVGEAEMGNQDSEDIRRDLNERRQSNVVSDNQEEDPQPAMDKSEGQLLEDIKADGPMLTSVPISPKGSAALVSPNDDDPLVYLKAWINLDTRGR